MAQTKPKAGQFYGVSNNGTDGQFLQTDGAGGMDWADTTIAPTLTSIDYPGTATAADTAGGESIIINGTGFQTGITCTIGGTSATTAFNSATQITITSPAKAAGQYTVAVTNTDGGSGSSANFIQYSGVPVWSTNSGSLGSVSEGGTASFQVTATEGSDTIEYAVTTGSLPSGLSLATATGAITGTAPAVSANTTTTFGITATDDENQTSSERTFSITVNNVAPSGQFNAKLFTGRSQNVTGFGFDIDLAWVFNRAAANGNFINDTVRGATETLWPTDNNAEDTRNVVTSFITDGVTIGDYASIGTGNNIVYGFKAGGAPTATNSAGVGNAPTAGSVMVNGVSSTTSLAGTIAAKKISVNTNLGLSIVQYTGTGSAATIAHELGGVPDFIIVKNLDANEKWRVYNSYSGATKYMSLDDSYGTGTASTIWNDTTPTSTVFSVGSDASVSGNGNNFIAYLFKNTAGFTKSGGYTGNGSATNGPIIETGFKPAYLILKSTSNSGTSWRLMDSTRNPSNPVDKQSDIQDSLAESTTAGVNFYENGFQLITTDTSLNGSGYTYTYLAIAGDGSTTTPSLANSFSNKLWTPNTSSTALSLNVGFKPTVFWSKYRQGSQNQYFNFDKWVSAIGAGEQGGREFPDLAGQASSTTYLYSYDPNGVTVNPQLINRTQTDSAISWAWKAGNGFSINTTGDQTSLVSVNQAAGISFTSGPSAPSSAAYTFAHGLSKAPEIFMYKATNYSYAYEVLVPKTFGVDAGSLTYSDWDYNKLNQTNAFTTSSWYSADNSVIKSNGWAASSYNFICFALHSVANFSKINKYTGNGTAGHAIPVGFAPDYVLIKRMNNTGNWYIFDSARKTGVYSDQLEANTANAENTGTYVELTSTGFSLNTTASNLNESGDTFLYMAFKQN